METATVLGSGVLGKAVTDALIKRNVTTKVLTRDLEKFKQLYVNEKIPGRIGVITGDLDTNQTLALAMEDTDAVFLCFNPKYSDRIKLMPRWIARVGDLAAALQARIVFPGNVLNFGRHKSSKKIVEEDPQNAHIELGQIRIALEQRLVRSAMEGASLSIIRFPDIYGPGLQQGIIFELFNSLNKSKTPKWQGNPSSKHDFLFSLDAGEAMVKTALEPRAADTSLHFPGDNPLTSTEFIKLVSEKFGNPVDPPFEIEKSVVSSVKGLVSGTSRERKELSYLFEDEIFLDGGKFDQIVGSFPRTKHQVGVEKTVGWFKSRFKN